MHFAIAANFHVRETRVNSAKSEIGAKNNKKYLLMNYDYLLIRCIGIKYKISV